MAKKEMTEEQAELFRELTKLSKRANQRLVRLERVFGKDTWASRKLKNRLDIEPLQAWTKTGRVRVNKSMTITQLRATIKATNQFLNSQTSTVAGIKKVRENQIKNISKILDIELKATKIYALVTDMSLIKREYQIKPIIKENND